MGRPSVRLEGPQRHRKPEIDLEIPLEKLYNQNSVLRAPDHAPVKVVTVWSRENEPKTETSTTQHVEDVAVLHELKSAGERLRQKCIMRLYCISQNHSASPLNVTTEMLRNIMLEHDISAAFLDIVSHFYKKHKSTEEAYCPPFVHHKSGGYHEYMYIIKYPELSPRGGEEHPWSIRQSALYHQIRLADQQSTYILISPRERSLAEETLCDWMANIRSATEAEEQAFAAHEIITSVYTSSWRPYLVHYELQLRDLSMRMSNLGGMDTDCVTHDDMIDLHSIERRLLQVGPLFESFAGILDTLGQCFVDNAVQKSSSPVSPVTEAEDTDSWTTTLLGRRDLMLSYQKFASALLKECASTSSLLNGLLELRNHSSILDLSRSTVVMSAIFLIYLSSTAVATVMAMPILYPNQDTNRIAASPQLWVYAAIAIPLTIATIGCWQFTLRWRRVKSRRKLQMMRKSNV